MIRQLGIPTWFCSFSAAETKWKPLLRVLAKLTKNMNYTDSDILKMTWFEKMNLLKLTQLHVQGILITDFRCS